MHVRLDALHLTGPGYQCHSQSLDVCHSVSPLSGWTLT